MGRLHTLRTSRDFSRVLSTGTRRRRGGLTVISAAPAGPEAAVGFVVGRTVGSAVVRNRARRRLRAAVMEVPGFFDRDRVVIATRAVATVPFGDLVEWLTSAITYDD